MRTRLALALALLVLAPVVLLTWLGARFAADERAASQARLEAVVQARLAELNAVIAGLLDAHAARLDAQAEALPLGAGVPAGADPIDALRAALRTIPEPAFVLDAEGRRLFPPEAEASSAAERALLDRTLGLWDGGLTAARARLDRAGPPDAPPVRPQAGATPQAEPQGSAAPEAPLNRAAGPTPGGPGRGWIGWYVGSGLNLVRWVARADGHLVAFELDRVVVLADLVAHLPPVPPGGGERGLGQRAKARAGGGGPQDAPSFDLDERFALYEAGGRLAHQWGALDATWAAPLSVRLPLPDPLGAWHLTWTGAPPAQTDPTLPLWAAVGAGALALLLLGVWFAREAGRELRRARQRVTFVNQVAHELKTPLTNIRLYAELLEEHLDLADEDLDARARRDVGIIVGESQRLSRLIANILTFAQHAREALTLRPEAAEPDAVVRAVVEQHQPSLAAAGVAVTLEPGARGAARLDADAVGQVVGNLLSNVAKYAAGAPVRVATARDGDRLQVTVHDGGPGVARAHRSRVFEPFFRVSSANTDRATGTGIGLGLARDLCRLHGGDLALVPTEAGACFVATLHAPCLAPPEVQPAPGPPPPPQPAPQPAPDPEAHR